MVNRRSPLLTGAPSLKWTFSKYPSTRATSVTESLAAVLPVKLRYSVTLSMAGLATVTVAGAAVEVPGLERQPTTPTLMRISNQNASCRKHTYEILPFITAVVAPFDRTSLKVAVGSSPFRQSDWRSLVLRRGKSR